MNSTPKEMAQAVGEVFNTPSLGSKLAATLAKEQATCIDPKTKEEMRRQEGIRQLHVIGHEFFMKAREVFTEGIEKGISTKDLYHQIGAVSSGDVEKHYPVMWENIDWYRDERGHRWSSKGGPVPMSMLDPDRFGPAWESFKEWARHHGLEPYWEVPNSQWRYLLRVKPLAGLS